MTDTSPRKRRGAVAQGATDARMLVATLVHELSNPLTCVCLALDNAVSLSKRGASIEDTAAALEVVRAGLAQVQAVLQHHRSTAGPDSVPLVDPRRAVDAAVRIVAASLGGHAVLRREYLHVPDVHAREAQLVQVFLNLLKNAARAVDQGRPGRITVRTSTATGGDALVDVEDNGCGVPPRLLDRVFEPFVTGVRGGSGLGLAISSEIVTSLGGRISIEQTSEQGTIVRVSLPAAPEVPE